MHVRIGASDGGSVVRRTRAVADRIYEAEDRGRSAGHDDIPHGHVAMIDTSEVFNQSVRPTGKLASIIVAKGTVRLVVGFVALLYFVGAFATHRALGEVFEMRRARDLVGDIGDRIPVLMPCYGRPEYLREVLDGLKRASGVEKSILIVSQDGHNEEIASMVDSVDFMPVVHLRHTPPFWGIPSLFLKTDAPTASNIFFLLRTAFFALGARGAFVLESDIVPSADALDYFTWVLDSLEADPAQAQRVFTVNGYHEDSRPGADPYSFTVEPHGFMVWGWLCPAWSWPTVYEGWTWFMNWDINMEHSIRRPNGLVSLSPELSRTKNVGMTGINFDVHDEAEAKKFKDVYTSDSPIDYSGHTPRFAKHPARTGAA